MMRAIFGIFKASLPAIFALHFSFAIAQVSGAVTPLFSVDPVGSALDAAENKLPREQSVRSATGIVLSAAARGALQAVAKEAPVTLMPLTLNQPNAIKFSVAINAHSSVNIAFTKVQFLDAARPQLGYQAVGSVEGDALSQVTWVDRAGVVSAVIQSQDRQLQIRPIPAANANAKTAPTAPSRAAVAQQTLAPGLFEYILVDIDQQQFRDHPAPSFLHEATSVLENGKHRTGEARQSKLFGAQLPKNSLTSYAIAPPGPSQTLAEDAITLVDVLIVYTAAASRASGGAAAMDSYISLAIAQTNQAYLASGVKQQLRLVHSQEVAYAESGDLNLDLSVLRTVGDGTLDDVHLLRDAYGADIVSLWVEDGGNSCGQSAVMNPVGSYYARTAFSVVARGCAVGNYSFAHELGHNMGLRHDVFADDTAAPYAFGHGFVDVKNKFRTIMAYDDACIAANTSCIRIGQFSSATAKYGQFATGDAALANAAAALNASRSTVAVFKTAVDLNAGGSIQFHPQTYGVVEGKTVALKVSRLAASAGAGAGNTAGGGAGGGASVRYLTVQQTATANRDFRTTSGTLTWRDGENSEKIIFIDTLLDAENEGTESFKVELYDFVGATPLLNSANGGSTAVVDIYDAAADAFPVGCVLPTQGWSTPPNATTGWSVGRDSSTEGGCSLKSNQMLSVGNSTRAQLQFEGEFLTGTISFDRRVVSEQSFDCFRFFIDGVAQQLGGTCNDAGGVGVSGAMDWSRIEVPIFAGRHTLLWSYEKDGNTSVGGDAAWIDRLKLPLPAQLARLEVRRNDATGALNNVGGNVLATTVGISCGAACSADVRAGSVVLFTAIPSAQSVLTSWTVNGVAACAVALNSPASFNGNQCAVTVADGASTPAGTQVAANFAPRLDRTIPAVHIAVMTPATPIVVTTPTTPTILTGSIITLNASITGSNPTGTITVRRVTNGTIEVMCAEVLLINGQASCSVPPNAQTMGLNLYQVSYSGDATNASAQQIIQHFAPSAANGIEGVDIKLVIEPATPIVGQNIRLTAVVTAANNLTPQGSVRFVDAAGNVVCVASLLLPISSASTVATSSCNTIAVAALAAGNAQTITAQYVPSAVNGGTTAATISYIAAITQAPNYADMWWAGEAQNGWGMSIAQHGNTQFNVLYIYDAAGKPIWVVMPGGSWNPTFTEYSGAVYEPTASPYYAANALPFTVGQSVGNVVITFNSTEKAVLRYNIKGVSGVKNIQRQVFGAALADEVNRGRLPVGDLWWGGNAENGWGINIAQQGTTLFGVWYTYDNVGNTTWMVLPGGTWQNNTYGGRLYTTTANAWLGSAYNASTLRINPAGALRLEFFDTSTALMQVEIPEQNFKQSKLIVRQQF